MDVSFVGGEVLHRAKLLEIYGLAMLLIALGWQVIIEDDTKAQVANGQVLVLNEKLNTIWTYLGEISFLSNQESLRATYDSKNQYFEQTKTFLGPWPKLLKVASFIRIALYVLGSLLVIGGKYIEYQYYKLQA